MKNVKRNKIVLIINNIIYEIVRFFLKIFTIVTLMPKTINKDKLPKKGGFILAGTHTGYLDTMLVGNLTLRPVHFLAKIELLKIPVLGWLLRGIGLIGVDRKKKNPKAKEEVLEALECNQIVAIFPEGTINRHPEERDVLPFKFGAVSFAQKSGKPIIPFAIADAHLFNYKSRIILGDPFYVKENEDLEKANQRLEKIVIKLLKEVRNYGKQSKKI